MKEGMITKIYPVGVGPLCGNQTLSGACMIGCALQYGGCIFSPEERKAQGEQRRAALQPQK